MKGVRTPLLTKTAAVRPVVRPTRWKMWRRATRQTATSTNTRPKLWG